MKFEVYEADKPKLLEFLRRHDESCKKDENGEWKYLGAIGGGLTYTFVPTSIGDLCTVKCTLCGEEIHLNDGI